MNIGFIYAYGIHPTLGGVANVTYSLAQLFRENGHSVWFVGLENSHILPDRDPNQVFLPSYDIDGRDNVEFLSTFLSDNKITCVINQTASYNTKTMSLLRKCKEKLSKSLYELKIVTSFHSSILTNATNYAYTKEIELKKKHLGLIFRILKSRIISKLLVWKYIKDHRAAYIDFLNNSDSIVVLCDGQRDEFLKMVGKVSVNRICVIPNPVPKEEIDYSIEKENIVLWVGQFSNNIKRPDWMINIWKKVVAKNMDWKLLMLGDGDAFESIKSRIDAEGINNVELTGRVKTHSYYQKAKIICMTSVHEAFPMVLMEALQFSVVPIVYNSFTSASFIIVDGVNGYLINPFDEEEYATRLDYILHSKETIDKFADSGRVRIENFSRDNIYKLWMSVLS